MNLIREVFTPVFVIRALFGFIVAGSTAWAVSFVVADYVSRASITGLSTAVQGLQTSVSTLTGSIQQVNSNLLEETRTLRTERDAFAKAVADKVAEQQRTADGAISSLVRRLDITNGELSKLTISINALSGNVRSVDQRFAASVLRQTNFEQFVTSILLRQGPPPIRQNWFEPWGLKELPRGVDILYFEKDPKRFQDFLATYNSEKK